MRLPRIAGTAPKRRPPGEARRAFSLQVPAIARRTRKALGWTQQMLALKANVSQSQVSRLESGDLEAVSIHELTAILDALDVAVTLTLESPFIARPRFVKDAAHARCVAHVAGRLERAGWEVRLEVEVQAGRSHGWIDVLAHQRAAGAVFVGEIKTTLDDLGGAQRQLSWYEREAWAAGRAIGWRFHRVDAALLVLATEDVERHLTEHAVLLQRAFPVRGRRLGAWLNAPAEDLPGSGLALLDPRSRRRNWLLSTQADGRRTHLPYRDYADFMLRVRTPRGIDSTAKDGASRMRWCSG